MMMKAWNDKNSNAKLIVGQICKFISIPLILMIKFCSQNIFFSISKLHKIAKMCFYEVKVRGRGGALPHVDYTPPPCLPLLQEYSNSDNYVPGWEGGGVKMTPCNQPCGNPISNTIKNDYTPNELTRWKYALIKHFF